MAREVLTRIWCDVCIEDDERVEAVETPPITIGGAKPRILALCEVHTKELFESFKVVLMDLGQVVPTGANAPSVRPPGSRSEGSGVFPCPVPGCHKGPKPFRHIQSLRNHTRDVHGIPIDELKATYGDPSTYRDTVAVYTNQSAGDLFTEQEEEAPSVTRAECPEEGCDVVYEWPKNSRPSQALGVHRRQRHGYVSPKTQRKAEEG